MKRTFRASLAAIALLTMTASDALACWADVPLERLVGDSPVVVVGSLGKAEQKKHKEHGQLKVAYISVSAILKNTLPHLKTSKGDRIPLSMPNGGESTDIVYTNGTSGIWILEFRDRTFWATYPKDFQPMSKERDVRQFIKKQEEEPSDVPSASPPEARVNPMAGMLKQDQALRQRFTTIAKGMTESQVQTIMRMPPHEIIRVTTWVYKLSPASDTVPERHWKLLVRFSGGKVQDFQDTYTCYSVEIEE